MEFNSTEQSVIWFRDRYNSGELILKPPYQRKPVWSIKQKCALIESILLGLPIPELYIQHTVEFIDGQDKSVYALVDGQQRIRTVLQFLGIDKSPSEQEANGFSLDKVNAESPYKDHTYETLTGPQRSHLLKYKFSVRNIEASDDDQVREIFKRINKYVTKLNDQELRNATYTGPFIELAFSLAEDDFWVQNKLVTPAQIRRMKDVEFISELLIGVIHGPQGGSAAIITEYYSQYEDYDDEFPNQKSIVERFNKTKKMIEDLFQGATFTRFRSNRTDFYSLFVALAVISIDKIIQKTSLPKLRVALLQFETDVDRRLADDTLKASSHVTTYVRAAEKGPESVTNPIKC